MNGHDDLERRLEAFYTAELPVRAPDWVLRTAIETIDSTPQRRAIDRGPWRFPTMNNFARLAVAAVAVIAVGAAGLVALGDTEPAASSPTLGPTFTPTTKPIPVIEMRIEPNGPPTTVPVHVHADATGDVDVDLVDVTGIRFKSPCYGDAICVYFDLAGRPRARLDDADRDWVAYGLMIDNDGDGVADVQVGIDNGAAVGSPPFGAKSGPYGPRSWQTDLETGETESRDGMYTGLGVDGHIGFISEAQDGPLDGWVGVKRVLATPELRFYFWASIIRDGKVVATDFAPDVGWLDGYLP